MLWIVLSVFEVQRGAFAVSSAARSAGRAFALAPNDAAGQARAEAVVRRALDDQGLEGAPFTLRVTLHAVPGELPQRDVDGHGAGLHQVEIPLLPDVLGGDAPSFALDATHTVPIGQYQEVDRAAP